MACKRANLRPPATIATWRTSDFRRAGLGSGGGGLGEEAVTPRRFIREVRLRVDACGEIESYPIVLAHPEAIIEHVYRSPNSAWDVEVLIRDRGELHPRLDPKTNQPIPPDGVTHHLVLVRSQRGETPIPENCGPYVNALVLGRGERYYAFHVPPASGSARPSSNIVPRGGAAPEPSSGSQYARAGQGQGPSGGAPIRPGSRPPPSPSQQSKTSPGKGNQ